MCAGHDGADIVARSQIAQARDQPAFKRAQIVMPVRRTVLHDVRRRERFQQNAVLRRHRQLHIGLADIEDGNARAPGVLIESAWRSILLFLRIGLSENRIHFSVRCACHLLRSDSIDNRC